MIATPWHTMPPARKRKATGPAQAVGPSSGDRRRSGRLSEKSGFFATACSPEEEEDDDDDEEDEDEDGAGAGAGYGTLPAKRARSRRPGTGRGGLRGRPVVEERDGGEGGADEDGGQEHENVDEEIEDFDEEAPGKLTFIPLPKMRPTGAQSYEDDRLHPNTLLFLKDLKANNKRTWLKSRPCGLLRGLRVLPADRGMSSQCMTESIAAPSKTGKAMSRP